MTNPFVEQLKKFSEDTGLSSNELMEKYDRRDLLNAIKTVIGHEVCEFIKGYKGPHDISYTDMQTDIRDFFNFFK